MPPRARVALLLALASLVSTPLLAQQLRSAPTLHEYFDVTGADLQGALGGHASGALGAREPGPARTSSRSPSGAPPLTLDVSEEEPVIDAQGMKSALPMPAPQGGLDPIRALNTLDSQTDQVDQLNYFSSFDPSVIPYKRVVSQNKVIEQGSYAFVVDPGQMRPVVIDPSAQGDGEDIFWGTFLLRTRAGELTPIPSVSPEQRVVEVRTEPAGELEVVREGAGNFYVRRDQDGLLRVTMRVAVARSYFDASFGPARWEELAADEVTQIPASAAKRALKIAREKGWSREKPAHDVLREMIGYFRDFESKAFPEEFQGQDVYSAIVEQKLGVCRHRSFAFVITASALGIPAHYVYNEAHAFVEVLWPGVGWRRVDLGGAANDVLMRTAASQKRVHDGGTKDDLPQPPAYLREIERMAAQNDGGSSGSGGGTKIDQDEAAQRTNAGTHGGVDPTTSSAQSSNAVAGSDQEFVPTADDGPNTPLSSPPPQDEGRVRTQTAVLSAPSALMRGQDFEVSGQVTGAGAGATIKAILVAPGASTMSEGAMVLGEGVAGEGGGVRLRLKMPPKLAIGRWSLKLVYAGDESRQPSESD